VSGSANAVIAAAEATLCVVSVALVVTGRRAARQRRFKVHKRRMLIAFGLQTVFLALFLGRLAVYGMTSPPPHGAAGWARYALLVGHEAISVPTIALVLAALGLGLAGRRHEHREVATMAAPLWLVSMTSGVVVYVLVHVLGL
jgi:putative membrane protein